MSEIDSEFLKPSLNRATRVLKGRFARFDEHAQLDLDFLPLRSISDEFLGANQSVASTGYELCACACRKLSGSFTIARRC
jgi:hypothetical protein